MTEKGAHDDAHGTGASDSVCREREKRDVDEKEKEREARARRRVHEAVVDRRDITARASAVVAPPRDYAARSIMSR